MSLILWFNDLPTIEAGLILAIGAVLISLVGTAVARVFFEEQRLALNNVIGGFKYMFLSQVYAGFIGFLLFGVYNNFDQMRSSIVDEANALTSLDRLAAAFPEGTKVQLRRSLHDYAKAVAEIEWPQMARRQGDEFSTGTLDNLEYVYGAVEVTSKKQSEVLKYSRELVTHIRDNRAAREMRSRGSLPIVLWMVAIVGTIGSIVFPWVFGTPNFNADMIMSTMSIIVMTTIVLVILKLSYPFGGDQGLTPTPIVAFAYQVPSGGG